MKAKWQPVSPRCTSTAWDRWLNSDRSVDPYIVWADATNFSGFGGLSSSAGQLPILIELANDWKSLELPVWKQAQNCPAAQPGSTEDHLIEFSLFEINGAWLEKLVKTTGPAELRDHYVKLRGPYVTGRILPANIECLMQLSSKVLRFQLGLPRVPRQDRQAFAAPSGATSTNFRQVVVGVIDTGFALAHPQLLDGADDSRVMHLWDQDDRADTVSRATRWRPVSGYNYGAEVARQDIDQALLLGRGDASPYAPLKPHSELRYLPVALEPDLLATQPTGSIPDFTMLTSTHGASVVDLAAGNHAPLANFRETQTQYGPLDPDRARTSSTARAWPLVLVQLPTRTAADTSGGSLGVHVVDGVRYIIDRAVRIPYRSSRASGFPVDLDVPRHEPATTDKPEPNFDNYVIVNISYGASAGPHDGTSILEKALQNLAGRPRTKIVLAAGNAHGSGTHARLRLKRGTAKLLHWRVGADNPLESYLEVWLPKLPIGAVPGQGEVQAQDFVVFVKAPGEIEACRLCVGEAMELMTTANGLPAAAAIFARKVVQGEMGTMILLAAGPTRRALLGTGTGRAPAPHGDWDITVGYGLGSTTGSKEEVVVHAWAERNDLLFGTARAQQSSVWSDDPVPEPTENSPTVIEFCCQAASAVTDEAPSPFQPAMSAGSVASGRPARDRFWRRESGDVVTAGGYRASDLEMAPYSAGGPGRGSAADNQRVAGGFCTMPNGAFDDPDSRRAPDADAVSDVGMASRGVRTAGMLPGISARVGGTSAAAPSVTRAIAETLFLIANQLASEDDQRHFFPDRDDSGHLPEGPLAGDARATLTPTKDDRFRQGLRRVPRQVAIKPR